MNDVINEKADLLHDVIYEIADDAQDLKFPVQRVVSFLVNEGFVVGKAESSKTSFVLYKENSKTIVTSNFIAFETLQHNDRERFKQNFYKYLISRSKIYYQSALQNSKAAKINLIQNQRRTCVSNMYYSLHNSFASMVEFYKSDLMENPSLIDHENDRDDETKLEHFVPRGLEVLIHNIDEIINSEKEAYILDEKMNAGRIRSYENPFTWIFPLFSNWFEKPQFVEIINTMDEAVKKVNLDNYAVDESLRRSQFEKQLKENLTTIKMVINEDNCSESKFSLLTLAAFLAYGYMLRQSADYDSLFEIKIPHQDIINWTIIASNFLNIVTEFLNENSNKSDERIQKLDAASSTEILRSPDTDLKKSIMTMTGIIIDKVFDLKQVIKQLYSQKGYKMINQRGKIAELNDGIDNVCICRMIFGTPLECFISFSKQGLFRIDIVMVDELKDTEFYKGVNQFYLEQLIHKDIIEKDLLQGVSKNANIVRGMPTSIQINSINYLDLVLGIHERIHRSVDIRTSNFLREYSVKKSNGEFVVNCMFSMNKSLLFERRVRVGYFITRNRQNLQDYEEGKIKKFLLIIFCSYSDNLSENEIASYTKILHHRFSNDFPSLEFNVEIIQLSEIENRQIVEGEFDFFEVIIESLIEKYEKVHFQSDEIKLAEDIPLGFEEPDDVDESVEIIIEEHER